MTVRRAVIPTRVAPSHNRLSASRGGALAAGA